MQYSNEEIAQIFEEIAKIMEIKGQNTGKDVFKIRAYQKAAQSVENYPYNLYEQYQNGKLEQIQGIGKDLFGKIIELFQTGKVEKYEEMKNSIPEGLLEMIKVPGIGPKQAKQFYDNFGIESIQQLEEKINNEKQELLQMDRMGEQRINQILKGIQIYNSGKDRLLLGKIYDYAQNLKDKILDFREVKYAYNAGSMRRMKETVGDLDILVVTNDINQTSSKVTQLEDVNEIIANGDTKTSVFLNKPYIQVDIRYIPEESIGAAMQYFTGSQQHNVKIRTIAKQKGYKVSEYGIYDINEEKKIGGEKEEEMYNILGLDFTPPELREDNQEVEESEKGNLPELIGYDELKGDLHVHSKRSDGEGNIEDVVQTAINFGYEYIAITDHSKSLGIANGLSEERMLQKMDEIDKLQQKYEGYIKILKGTECDILSNGELDYTDEILAKCDIVVGSIHMGFTKDQTERYLKAMDNPNLNIIGHPSGRMIGERDSLEADWNKIFDKAIKNQIALEASSQPLRLDLKDTHIRQFISMGGKIAINTDSHTLKTIGILNKFGIGQARRGWATKADVVNAWNLNDLEKFLKKN